MFWRKKKAKEQQDNDPSKKRYSFRVNQRLRLLFKSNGKQIAVMTVIQDVLDDRIRVLKLHKAYETLLLENKSSIEVELYDNDGIYRFKSHFLGTVVDGVEMEEISKPKIMRRHQRREYERLDIDWQIKYEYSSSDRVKYPYLKPQGLYQGQDISAAGIRVLAKQEIPKGIVCNLSFILDPSYKTSVNVKAEIIACEQDIVGKTYVVRMAFVDLKEELRIRINDYVSNNL